jgi:hypothetical protein
MINDNHFKKAEAFMEALRTTCEDRRLPMPEIGEVCLTDRNARVYAFAVFPQQFGHKLEVYKNPNFLDQLSSTLGGMAITYSNSTGFRLVAVLEDNSTIGKQRPLNLGEQPGPLYVPIGDRLNGRALWLSIVEMDSVLVGGSRRMGKTRLLHGWIQALQHGGEALVYLWDGKPNCIEFGRYAGQPGVTVIGERDLDNGVNEIKALMIERAELLAQEGVADFKSYNALGKPLKPIVFVIDELASINNTAVAGAEEILRTIEDLISRGGAFGIYPVLATQRPTADAVRGVSKTNLQTRISLPVPSHTDSKIILERVGAEKLPKVQGRVAIVWQANLIEAQAYLVDLPEQKSVVSQASDSAVTGGEGDAASENEADLAQRCLDENDGLFTLGWLTEIGMGPREARALQTEWAERDLIVKDRSRNNAYCVKGGLSVCRFVEATQDAEIGA